ncbi:MAG: sulfatase-like hydrolase/transferase [Nitrososphaerota archaeon]|nr:sulfatase-like hydrolase/transferase [Nitrososphaerota archaeon]
MKRPNVILIVLDTLREDYSNGLSELESMSFKKYSNVLAPDSWTVPSHASIFTGLMPSEHRAHRVFNVDNNARMLAELCKEAQRNHETITSLVRELGYETYAWSCNALISPSFGYEFEDFTPYEFYGKPAHEPAYLYGKSSYFSKLVRLMLNREFETIHAQASLKSKRGLGKALGLHPLEKGSKYVLQDLKRKKLGSPFFLFVNLMEAHDPYNWNDGFNHEIQYYSLTRKIGELRLNWFERYPRHASLAARRAMDAVNALRRYLDDSVVIVTSDHGQLLGEGGMYGHGYTMNDNLLKVPLYVRYPGGAAPPDQVGRYMSLTSIKSLVDHVVGGDPVQVGSDVVLAESFGPDSSAMMQATDHDERETMASAFDHRVKVYTAKGSGVYNKHTDTAEEVQGDLSAKEMRELASGLPTFDHDFSRPAVLGESVSSFAQDDMEVRERLRRLGYE